jgi:hypothetical protein
VLAAKIGIGKDRRKSIRRSDRFYRSGRMLAGHLGRVIAFFGVAGVSLGVIGSGFAQTGPNRLQNNADRQSWELFMTVNADAASAGDNNALFETWASDGDTFRAKPVWPSGGSQMQIGARALSLAIEQLHPHFRPELLPTGSRLIGEETRRNRPAFDFIVQNHLFKVGLKAAFAAAKPIAFPVDSIEVKANWVEVDRLKEFNGFAGSRAAAAAAYHVNETGGKQYALVSFHIISNRVPNWTWATFEHKDNPGRCDVLGCKDSFGAVAAYVAPRSQVESQTLSRLRQIACASRAIRQGSPRSGVRQLLPERLAVGLRLPVRRADPSWQLSDRAEFCRPILVHDMSRSRGLRRRRPRDDLWRL